ncbi:MAG: DNA polymerase III subunit chi [Pseudomonadota bacterium]
MVDVFFYHLERSAPHEVLPSLLEKTLKKGWRAMVKLPSREAMQAMDEALWTYRDDSFLPHGIDGADQPVLLTLDDHPANGADAIFLAPGVEMAPEAMEGFERCVLLFTPSDTEEARAQWKALKSHGHDVTYWRQTMSGAWEKASA